MPFNALYWNFINQHQAILEGNNRLKYNLGAWSKMSNGKKDDILTQAAELLAKLDENMLLYFKT